MEQKYALVLTKKLPLRHTSVKITILLVGAEHIFAELCQQSVILEVFF